MIPFRLPVGKLAVYVVNFLQVHLPVIFNFIVLVVGSIVNGLYAILAAPLPLLLVAILVAIAWWLRGYGFAIFTALSFLLIQSMDLWSQSIETLALVLTASLIALLISLPLGIFSSRSNKAAQVIRPILDFMQTMPAFVYLIPAIIFFGLGSVPAVIATLIFAIPPAIRLTDLGIRQVDNEVIEAATSFGSTPNQILFKVQLPMAMATIMAGVNQMIMLALSMVVIAGMIGAEGLGAIVLQGIDRLDVGLGFEGGVSIVLLAIYLDRVTEALGRRTPGRQLSSSE